MKSLPIAFAVVLSAIAGCRNEEKHAAPAPVAAPAESASAPASAQQALDRMDTRTPVPLLPMMANHQKQNMRDHLVVVQEIVLGLASEDFDAVERAARRAGYSEQMGQMCTHMGAGAPGFTDQALSFHRSADTIAEAAHRHDRDAILGTLGSTLQKCTGCHAAFKQNVVDEAAWTRLTTTPAPAGHSP